MCQQVVAQEDSSSPTSKHALIHNAVACKEKAITGKVCQRGIRNFVDVAWHELTAGCAPP